MLPHLVFPLLGFAIAAAALGPGRLEERCPPKCRCDEDVTNAVALYCDRISHALNATAGVGGRRLENLTLYDAATEFESSSVSSFVDLRLLVMDDLGLTSINHDPDVPTLEFLTTLSLNNNRLLRLTMNAFAWCRNLRELRLAGNGIKELHADVFVALRLLETLNLANNNLQTLDFKLMSSLITLDLSNNQIGRIAQIGTDLPNLRDLRLCGNQMITSTELENVSAPKTNSLCLGDAISSFDSSSFVGTPNIVHLELVGKSALSQDMVGALVVLKRLQVLTLSYFEMDDRLQFGFKDLRELHLNNMDSARNYTLDKDTFRELTKLTLLDLRGSSALASSFLSSTEELHLPASIQVVSLQDTRLSRVDTLKNLENLTGVDLSQNAFRCDAHLRGLVKLLLSRPVVLLHSNETRCADPAHLRGEELLSAMAVASILSEANSSSASTTSARNADQTNPSEIERILIEFKVSAECLFYVAAIASLLAIVLLIVSVVLCVCLIKRSRKARRCTIKDGSMEGFVRADNEYTFDNFTLSDTIAECRRLQSQHTLTGAAQSS